MRIPATTSQTVGPYFAIGLSPLFVSELAGPDTPGERFTLEGRVLDSNRQPVPDAMIEVWQTNAKGEYTPLDQAFRGFGRVPAAPDGSFRFSSIKPGPVAGPHGTKQAPHLEISVFMRGLLQRLVTRIYFEGEAANAHDPILNLVPTERRQTLIARRADGSVFHWEVLLQGPDETVFFDI